MEIPVLVEPLNGTGFRARCGDPLPLSAEGMTHDEAVQRLRDKIAEHLAGGATLVAVEVPGVEHPLAKYAGMFKDNPLFDEWQREIAEMRRREDEAADQS